MNFLEQKVNFPAFMQKVFCESGAGGSACGVGERLSSFLADSGGYAPGSVLFVGIDVSKRFHCVRALNSLDRRVSEHTFFANRRKGFKELLAKIEGWRDRYGCDSVEVAMEPTADYWKPLYGFLVDRGFDVKLVSTVAVRRVKDARDNSPEKSDKKDALVIAGLLKDGNVLDFRMLSGDWDEAKRLLLHIDDLQKTFDVHRNHLEHFLSEHFPEIGDVFNKVASVTMRKLLREGPFPKDLVEAGLEKVSRILWDASKGQMGRAKARRLLEAARNTVGVPEKGDAVRIELEDILDMLDLTGEKLKKRKAFLEKTLERLPQHHILKSIDGVGIMSGGAITAFLGDLKEYRNFRQVLKKAGLNLYSFSSGSYRGRSRISRRGSGLLRKMLYSAALRHTHAGAAFYDKYTGLRKRGKSARQALVAIMRHILKIAYALVRDDRMFQRDYGPGAERDAIVKQRAEAA